MEAQTNDEQQEPWWWSLVRQGREQILVVEEGGGAGSRWSDVGDGLRSIAVREGGAGCKIW